MVFVSAMLHRLFPQTSVPRACLKAVGCWVQTETVICSVAEADKEDVDKAVKAARKAFDQGKWPKTTGAERGRVLNKCGPRRCKHPTTQTCLPPALRHIPAEYCVQKAVTSCDSSQPSRKPSPVPGYHQAFSCRQVLQTYQVQCPAFG